MSNIRQLSFFCFIFLLLVVPKVIGQRCAESGQWCSEDVACCGGCCRKNVCLDMDGPCTVKDDLCLTHICPPGSECYTFQPSCEGCAPEAECR